MGIYTHRDNIELRLQILQNLSIACISYHWIPNEKNRFNMTQYAGNSGLRN